MADTTHYVRDDVRAFLTMLQQMDRKPLEDAPVDIGREAYVAMGPLVEADARELAVIRDLTCPVTGDVTGNVTGDGAERHINMRLYDARDAREPGPVIMFYHGGGFVIGNLESHHALCTEIAAEMDLPVVSVDYRLAPEAPFPAAPDDCEAATRWVAAGSPELGRTATSIITMGDSAGGNLAIVVANQLATVPADVPVVLQVPIYPVADDTSKDRSFADFAEGFLLTASTMTWFDQQYSADPADPRNSPMLAEVTAPPPTVLCTAGLDPLRDSGRRYAAHLIQQGTDVTYLEFAGTLHGFVNLRKAMPSANKDLHDLFAAMHAMLERQG